MKPETINVDRFVRPQTRVEVQPLRGIDLYCGAGGMTTGAQQSGYVRVDLAVNHWRPAILTHSENHPHTRHICAEMEHVDPIGDKTLPGADIIMAGVECTHHSNAKGGAPVSDQKRSSARNVLDWVRAKLPKYLVIENVREFRDWGPTRLKRGADGKKFWDKKHRQWAREADPDCKGQHFKEWVAGLESLGYYVEHRLLNAADYGAATKRIRLFVVARLGGGPIPWPVTTHAQVANGKPQWRGAWEAIDWNRTAPSIFGRVRPLAEKTLKRVKIGLCKFNAPQTITDALDRSGFEPYLVKLRGTSSVAATADPMPTITAGGNHLYLAQPYLVNLKGRSNCADVGFPLPTMTAHAQHLYLAEPHIVKYHSGADVSRLLSGHSSVRQPLPTIDTNPRFALAQPYLFSVDQQSGGGSLQQLSMPLSTITVKQRHCLAMPFMVQTQGPGVGDMRYAGVQSVSEPFRTFLSRINHGVAVPFVYQLIGRGAGRSYNANEPLPTIVASRENFGIVEPFLVPHFNERDGQASRSHSIYSPMPTVTSRGAGYLVRPFLVDPNWQDNRGGRNRVHDIFAPLGTITTCNQKHVAIPFLLPRQGYFDARQLKRCRSIYEPLNTITAVHTPAHLIVPYLIDVNHGESNRSPGGRVHPVNEPFGTITGKRAHGLIMPEPIVVNYYGTGIAHGVREPLSTVTTKHRHGLVLFGEHGRQRRLIVLNDHEASLFWAMRLLGIDDIGFRMLDVDELAKATGLPDDYVIHGNKAEQIKQVGNAVCPDVMKALCVAIGEHEIELAEAA